MAALQAAIDASRTVATSTARPAYTASRQPPAFRDTDAAAGSLLWRIRTKISVAAPAVVQFSPCSVDGTSAAVAHAFARAAAAAIGRTLLINAREAATPGPLPDAYIPRLYHQSISGDLLFGLLAPQPGAATVAGGMFNVIVLDQSSPLAGGGACVTAPLCTGTILVVEAGATDLAAIKSAVGRIASLGGTILGAVLAGVPSWAFVE
jgi:hypothetical protein